jgi:hypothetical protein
MAERRLPHLPWSDERLLRLLAPRPTTGSDTVSPVRTDRVPLGAIDPSEPSALRSSGRVTDIAERHHAPPVMFDSSL